MKNIKLVIWDLDETFWKGTLSEEGITPISEHLDLVKKLTDRGIINSICSKNDFEQTKKTLQELNIWEHFIFPSIAWSPKGESVKQILSDCQLRPENVLFLDDNHSNIEEVKFYNKGIVAELPAFTSGLLDHEAFVGKDDSSHSRLKQYKILEEKADAGKGFSSNTDFLKASNIQVQITSGADLLIHAERIHELLNRTNQLNFTKKRLSLAETKGLLSSPGELGLIQVKDNFGDYGYVGFYALRSERLEHFVFSCRILNLGIAQYLYAKLGYPSLSIVPEVAETLDQSKPDWITEAVFSNQAPKPSATEKPKIFFKGGCDLDQMLFYVKDKLEIEAETNYVASNNIPIHNEHSLVLTKLQSESDLVKKELIAETCTPFIDQDFFKTSLFDSSFDCLVISLLMDYTQEIYHHKRLGVNIPFGGYYDHWTDTTAHERIRTRYEAKGIPEVDQKTLDAFAATYQHHGQIEPELFVQNLKEIRSRISNETPMVFINGAEVEPVNNPELNALKRHQEMNAALDQFISEETNCHLLDIREHVSSGEQLTNNLRHYTREVYQALATDLLTKINDQLDLNVSTKVSSIKKLRIAFPLLHKVFNKLGFKA